MKKANSHSKRNFATDFTKGLAIGVVLVGIYLAPYTIHKARANPVLIAGTVIGTAATVYAAPYAIHEANKYYFGKGDCPPGMSPQTQKFMTDFSNTKAIDIWNHK